MTMDTAGNATWTSVGTNTADDVVGGTWYSPCAIGNKIYAIEYISGRLVTMDTSGNATWASAGTNTADDVVGGTWAAICAIGNKIYAIEYISGRLVTMDTSGNATWASVGTNTADDVVSGAWYGLCAIGNKIYAIDSSSCRLVTLDTAGNATWTSVGANIANNVVGGTWAAICAIGNKIYAIEYASGRLVVMDLGYGDGSSSITVVPASGTGTPTTVTSTDAAGETVTIPVDKLIQDGSNYYVDLRMVNVDFVSAEIKIADLGRVTVPKKRDVTLVVSKQSTNLGDASISLSAPSKIGNTDVGASSEQAITTGTTTFKIESTQLQGNSTTGYYFDTKMYNINFNASIVLNETGTLSSPNKKDINLSITAGAEDEHTFTRGTATEQNITGSNQASKIESTDLGTTSPYSIALKKYDTSFTATMITGYKGRITVSKKRDITLSVSPKAGSSEDEHTIKIGTGLNQAIAANAQAISIPASSLQGSGPYYVDIETYDVDFTITQKVSETVRITLPKKRDFTLKAKKRDSTQEDAPLTIGAGAQQNITSTSYIAATTFKIEDTTLPATAPYYVDLKMFNIGFDAIMVLNETGTLTFPPRKDVEIKIENGDIGAESDHTITVGSASQQVTVGNNPEGSTSIAGAEQTISVAANYTIQDKGLISGGNSVVIKGYDLAFTATMVTGENGRITVPQKRDVTLTVGPKSESEHHVKLGVAAKRGSTNIGADSVQDITANDTVFTIPAPSLQGSGPYYFDIETYDVNFTASQTVGDTVRITLPKKRDFTLKVKKNDATQGDAPITIGTDAEQNITSASFTTLPTIQDTALQGSGPYYIDVKMFNIDFEASMVLNEVGTLTINKKRDVTISTTIGTESDHTITIGDSSVSNTILPGQITGDSITAGTERTITGATNYVIQDAGLSGTDPYKVIIKTYNAGFTASMDIAERGKFTSTKKRNITLTVSPKSESEHTLVIKVDAEDSGGATINANEIHSISAANTAFIIPEASLLGVEGNYYFETEMYDVTFEGNIKVADKAKIISSLERDINLTVDKADATKAWPATISTNAGSTSKAPDEEQEITGSTTITVPAANLTEESDGKYSFIVNVNNIKFTRAEMLVAYHGRISTGKHEPITINASAGSSAKGSGKSIMKIGAGTDTEHTGSTVTIGTGSGVSDLQPNGDGSYYADLYMYNINLSNATTTYNNERIVNEITSSKQGNLMLTVEKTPVNAWFKVGKNTANSIATGDWETVSYYSGKFYGLRTNRQLAVLNDEYSSWASIGAAETVTWYGNIADTSGNIYAINYDSGQLAKFDSSAWANIGADTADSATPDYWIKLCFHENKIHAIGSTGQMVNIDISIASPSWSIVGSAAPSGDWQGICSNGINVYTLDQDTGQFAKFDGSKWEPVGSSVTAVTSITLCSDRRYVYAIDYISGRLLSFDYFATVPSWTSRGTNTAGSVVSGGLWYGMCHDGHGNLYTMNSASGQLLKFSTTTDFKVKIESVEDNPTSDTKNYEQPLVNKSASTNGLDVELQNVNMVSAVLKYNKTETIADIIDFSPQDPSDQAKDPLIGYNSINSNFEAKVATGGNVGIVNGLYTVTDGEMHITLKYGDVELTIGPAIGSDSSTFKFDSGHDTDEKTVTGIMRLEIPASDMIKNGNIFKTPNFDMKNIVLLKAKFSSIPHMNPVRRPDDNVTRYVDFYDEEATTAPSEPYVSGSDIAFGDETDAIAGTDIIWDESLKSWVTKDTADGQNYFYNKNINGDFFCIMHEIGKNSNETAPPPLVLWYQKDGAAIDSSTQESLAAYLPGTHRMFATPDSYYDAFKVCNASNGAQYKMISGGFTKPINAVLKNHNGGTTIQELTTEACTNLKTSYGNNIRIYVVKYRMPTPSASNAYDHINACATDPAYVYDVGENNYNGTTNTLSAEKNLQKALDAIAADIKSAGFANYEEAHTVETSETLSSVHPPVPSAPPAP
ncbi:hypothetical protein FACS189472_09940 [Alphaproteobacteria bacterium]|nr:hypothetical protein FACS189472_09940 [Alphaproteobacteria bacterium]